MAVSRVAVATVQNPTSNAAVTPVWAASPPPDGAIMVALIAAIVQTTITTPSGWTLVGTQDAGANVRSWLFSKTASGEGAAPTWTLGTATKNGATIAAYSGALALGASDWASRADTIAMMTTMTPSLTVVNGAARVDMCVGRHASTGSPAQYSTSDAGASYLNRFGSNSGTDLTYAVTEDMAPATGAQSYMFTSTALEAQAVAWSVQLEPSAPPPTIAGRWGVHL